MSIKTACSTSSINSKDGKVNGVTLSTGEILPFNALLTGIGILPNIDVADKAGIACEDGILVDETGRTNIPNVYAGVIA